MSVLERNVDDKFSSQGNGSGKRRDRGTEAFRKTWRIAKERKTRNVTIRMGISTIIMREEFRFPIS
jgi:hypothetical protein